jgi:hypothetical protein
VKPRILHSFQLPCKPWRGISTGFITNLPESSRDTKILVVVNRLIGMAYCIPLFKKDSLTVARGYLESRWKYHRFPEDEVSD